MTSSAPSYQKYRSPRSCAATRPASSPWRGHHDDSPGAIPAMLRGGRPRKGNGVDHESLRDAQRLGALRVHDEGDQHRVQGTFLSATWIRMRCAWSCTRMGMSAPPWGFRCIERGLSPDAPQLRGHRPHRRPLRVMLPYCSSTSRTARSRTSGAYRLGRPIASIFPTNEVSGKPGTVQGVLRQNSILPRVLIFARCGAGTRAMLLRGLA